MRHELWKMDSGSQLSRMLYRSYLVSGSQLSRSLSSDAGTLGWSDTVSHDCGSFVECGPTIMPHSPAKSIFRLHVISSVHTHTHVFTHRGIGTQKLLHTDFFYTQTLLHTEAFTHKNFYTQTLLHRRFHTHRSIYTQKRLRTDPFTHKQSH